MKKTKKTVKKVNEGAYKSFNDIDLSKISGTATKILTDNFERFNACRTIEDVIVLCHELFDNAGLNTAWTNKFFYNLDQIKRHYPNPQRAYEQAMLFMNNARMKGMGLGLGRRFYEGEDDECKGKKCESKSACKYTKKQIMEAIKHWEGVLKQMNESSVNDGIHVDVKFDISKPDVVTFWSLDSYGFGIKSSDDALDIFRQWKAEIEKYYAEKGFNVEVVSIEGPVHYDNEFNVGLKCLAGCNKAALKNVLNDEGAL